MLKLSPGVLPPILSQAFGNYEKNLMTLVYISDKNFKIEEPARMVSVYPTWRDYIQLGFKPAELPSANFMPKTSAEKRLWDAEVKKRMGNWCETSQLKYGMNQFAKLDRDYQGMILYKKTVS